MSWFVHLLVNTVVLIVVAGFFDNFYLSGVMAAIIASVLLSIFNAIVRPLLIILTLPVTLLTLGLFLFVINAITLSLTAWVMGDSFVINGFGMAILAAVIISILNALIQKIIVEPMVKR
ncbi:phage holin family protein [Alkalihalobacillus sp. LMS39]|uniref:phage holin family protein n=1 Tax=Alkalihalobacillus sp. LMS39 TaxID=2924032 RepID=UPI001FB24AC0|nr:phage holin family protein [Alkalihalobacillus sp. LMS39]UOE93762.1 phage holin family protein [Alkalihalobacillus sp. LMS39]